MKWFYKEDEHGYRSLNIMKVSVSATVAAFLLLTILLSFYTVRDGTVGVVSTLGKYDDNVSKAGLHWKVPFVQTVYIEDVKLKTANYKGPKDLEDTAGVTNKPYITVLDNKNLPISIELTLQYTPDADSMASILRTYGRNYFDKLINPIARDVSRDVLGQYEAESIAIKRVEIGKAIIAALQENFKKIPFTLSNVALRNIVLPPSVQNKILQVQEAKQEEQRLQMAEKQALVQKRIQIIDAQREAEKLVIAAKAEADKAVELANGQAKAITVRSKATAAANKRVASSLTSLLVKQHTIEQWNGSYPRVMSGDSGMLLSIDSKK